MKILSITTLLAAALLSLAACNKQYDTEVSDSQTGNTNNGSGGGSSSGGFNWTGTAPFSLKLNDTAFIPETTGYSEGGGYSNVSALTLSGWGIQLVFPTSTSAGQVISSPTPGAFTAINPFTNTVLIANGKIKIVTNDAHTIEGYFYGELKDASGLSPVVVRATEGYFKFDKE